MSMKWKKWRLTGWIALWVLLLSGGMVGLAWGDLSTGTIEGRLREFESLRPLPGIVVTALRAPETPADAVTTDAQGRFLFPALPVGEYRLSVETTGFLPLTQEGIVVRDGKTLHLRLELVPASRGGREREVVKTHVSPLDPTSTASETVLSRPFFESVPVGRDFSSVLDVAPSAHDDGLGLTLQGASSTENAFTIDGIDVTDPVFGIRGSAVNLDFVEEIRIESGGYAPESGRATGGIVEVTTRSGGNDFHGDVFFNVMGSALQGDPRDIRRIDNALEGKGELDLSTDVGFDLGGAIVRDKLWFFVGFAPFYRRDTIHKEFYRLAPIPPDLALTTIDIDDRNAGPEFYVFANCAEIRDEYFANRRLDRDRCTEGTWQGKPVAFIDRNEDGAVQYGEILPADLTEGNFGRSIGLDLDGNGLPDFEATPATQTPFTRTWLQYQFLTKLTWNPTNDHRAEFSLLGTPLSLEGPLGGVARDMLGSMAKLERDTYDLALKWQSRLLHERLLFNATYALHLTAYDRFPANDFGNLPMTRRAFYENFPGYREDSSGNPLRPDGTPIILDERTIARLLEHNGIAGVQEEEIRSITPEEIKQRLGAGEVTVTGEDGTVRAVCADDPTTLYDDCPVFGYRVGGNGFFQDETRRRNTLATDLTAFFDLLGRHRMKPGVALSWNFYSNREGYSGGYSDTLIYIDDLNRNGVNDPDDYLPLRYRFVRFQENPSPEDVARGTVLDFRKGSYADPEGGSRSVSRSLDLALFWQDSWGVLENLTLRYGLRWERQQFEDDTGEKVLRFSSNLAPRVGIIWDFLDNGRSKAYGSYGRFYGSIPLDIDDRLFRDDGLGRTLGVPTDPRNSASCASIRENGVNPTRPCQGPEAGTDADTDGIYDEVVLPLSETNGGWFLSGPIVQENPSVEGIDGEYVEEGLLGLEYEIVRDLVGGARYTRRRIGSAVEDFSPDGQHFVVVDPGGADAPSLPPATRDYEGLEVFLEKHFSNGYQFQASYLRARLEGNYVGGFTPENGQLAPNTTTAFDSLEGMVNRQGPLPGDHRHTFKFDGAYTWGSLGIRALENLTTGISLRMSTGGPISTLGADVRYGSGEVFILPRGEVPEDTPFLQFEDRLPTFWQTDLFVGYDVKLRRQSRLNFNVTLFNVFDRQSPLAVDQNFTFDPVVPQNADFYLRHAIEQPLFDPDGGQILLKRVSRVGRASNPVSPYGPLGPYVYSGVARYNPGYQSPTALQAPWRIRLGVRLSF